MRRDGQTALASAELYVIIDLPKNQHRHGGQRADARHRAHDARGARRRVDRRGPHARVRHQRGRRRARRQRAVRRASTVGSQVRSGQNTWKVVGIFEADGGVAETEIWCDARVLQGAYRRGNTYQIGARPARLVGHLRHLPRLAHRQPAAERAGAARDGVLRAAVAGAQRPHPDGVGFGIAALMGIGAVFGAILTMYTAVSTRVARDRHAARARLQRHARWWSRCWSNRWRWRRSAA